jgi:hypothetical protein
MPGRLSLSMCLCSRCRPQSTHRVSSLSVYFIKLSTTNYCTHTKRLPISDVHPFIMEKSGLWLVRVGGARTPLSAYYHHVYKVAVYAPQLSGQIHSPYLISINICTAKTKYRKFQTNIPRKGISGPQSRFPHSCICEPFIYFHARSAYSAGGNI